MKSVTPRGVEHAMNQLVNHLGSSRFRVGNFRAWGPMKPRDFQDETLFPSGGILGMLCRWPTASDSRTATASLVSFPRPAFEAFSLTPGRWSSPSSGAEKNALRRLRASRLDLLRDPPSACPGALVGRPAALPRLRAAPGPVSAVRGREERTLGRAGRQP